MILSVEMKERVWVSGLQVVIYHLGSTSALLIPKPYQV